MAKQHFVQLAQTYIPIKHHVSGWLMSEKLDGIRAIWDGGISRGLPCSDVPYANVAKHGRYLEPPRATGLWTRYAQPIQAPDWFLNHLPPMMLDGELWIGRGRFQETVSCVKTLQPCPDAWKQVKYMVFDMPSAFDFLRDRTLNEPNLHLDLANCWGWAIKRGLSETMLHQDYWFCELPASPIMSLLDRSPVCRFLDQFELPKTIAGSDYVIKMKLAEVEAGGGEGLIVRARYSKWSPTRTWDMLKVKGRKDAEATVVGYVWGRETDKGSKLLGKMGALVVQMDNGIKFELSGFTDAEREMSESVLNRPGEAVVDGITNPTFPIGKRISFKYRELTNDGIPKEAAYWRDAVIN